VHTVNLLENLSLQDKEKLASQLVAMRLEHQRKIRVSRTRHALYIECAEHMKLNKVHRKTNRWHISALLVTNIPPTLKYLYFETK